jgi:methyl-accepting chemotaxis protein
MQAIVRKAQRDFQFATIYEQRKTNQILVAGFTNLAQALKDMTWQLTASIDDLARSVDGMASTLDESLRAIHSRLGDVADTASRHADQASEAASQASMREQKVLQMLDNIQHRR